MRMDSAPGQNKGKQGVSEDKKSGVKGTEDIYEQKTSDYFKAEKGDMVLRSREVVKEIKPFLETYGLTVQFKDHGNNRITASFIVPVEFDVENQFGQRPLYISDGEGGMDATYGTGKTNEEALKNYIDLIKGKTIVIEPDDKEKRKEIVFKIDTK